MHQSCIQTGVRTMVAAFRKVCAMQQTIKTECFVTENNGRRFGTWCALVAKSLKTRPFNVVLRPISNLYAHRTGLCDAVFKITIPTVTLDGCTRKDRARATIKVVPSSAGHHVERKASRG